MAIHHHVIYHRIIFGNFMIFYGIGDHGTPIKSPSPPGTPPCQCRRRCLPPIVMFLLGKMCHTTLRILMQLLNVVDIVWHSCFHPHCCLLCVLVSKKSSINHLITPNSNPHPHGPAPARASPAPPALPLQPLVPRPRARPRPAAEAARRGAAPAARRWSRSPGGARHSAGDAPPPLLRPWEDVKIGLEMFGVKWAVVAFYHPLAKAFIVNIFCFIPCSVPHRPPSGPRCSAKLWERTSRLL